MQNYNFLNLISSIFPFQVRYADYVWKTRVILNFMLTKYRYFAFSWGYDHKTLGFHNWDHTLHLIPL